MIASSRDLVDRETRSGVVGKILVEFGQEIWAIGMIELI